MTDAPAHGDEPEDQLIRVLAEYWNEIEDLADAEQRERLRGLVAGTAEPDPVEARAALADELLDLLPPDHRVARVAMSGVMFRRPGQADPDSGLGSALRWLSLRVLPLVESGGEPKALGEFDQQVQARLLSLPWLSPDEVRGSGVDPGDLGLIRLRDPDGAVQLPAFQFTPAGQPWPIVRAVNERLDAAGDPWGVTCWWVDPHARLETTPAGLLGQDKDALLRRAAAAVGEEC